jgi:hypothetical protein
MSQQGPNFTLAQDDRHARGGAWPAQRRQSNRRRHSVRDGTRTRALRGLDSG